MINENDLNLGTCCACGKNREVRNIIMLHRLCPIPGHGWGCLQCGLPMDYATAVLCDACMEGPYETGPAEIKFVCTGYPASDGRTPIEETPEVKIKHNMMHHPEALVAMTWFDDSPDYGLPECVCSLCGEQIPDPEELKEEEAERFIPLRLFKKSPGKSTQEARFCMDCAPAVLRYMIFKEAEDEYPFDSAGQ